MMAGDDERIMELDDRQLLHQLKNYLAVILGFCDLLVNDLPAHDRKCGDISEVRKAAQSAVALLPELSKRLD